MSKDKIRRLNVIPKAGHEITLVPVPKYRGCQHDRYEIDERSEKVTCADCGASLNPMWVLSSLCNEESKWHRLRASYQDEMKRLQERSRTKCLYCGRMTTISHK